MLSEREREIIRRRAQAQAEGREIRSPFDGPRSEEELEFLRRRSRQELANSQRSPSPSEL